MVALPFTKRRAAKRVVDFGVINGPIGLSIFGMWGTITGTLGFFGISGQPPPRYYGAGGPSAVPPHALVYYHIGNDNGTDGLKSSPGGNVPIVRTWDGAGTFAGGRYLYDNQRGNDNKCGAGSTTCTSMVYTQKSPDFTLLTGRDDPICITWAGIMYPGMPTRHYGILPGNWAAGCALVSDEKSAWDYAQQSSPMQLPPNEPVLCLWLGDAVNGNQKSNIATGLQIHWEEFMYGTHDTVRQPKYYCGGEKNPPLGFRHEPKPANMYRWSQKPPSFPEDSLWIDTDRNLTADATDESPAADGVAFIKRFTPGLNVVMGTHGDVEVTKMNQKRELLLARRGDQVEEDKSLAAKLAVDPLIRKSHLENQPASLLCDRSANALGRSFVSYPDQKFCFMPTKTLYDFCENIEAGACWSDSDNRVIIKGAENLSITIDDIPDLSHITETVIWTEDSV